MNDYPDSQHLRDLEPPLLKAVQAVLAESPPADAVARVLERAKRLEVGAAGNASQGVWDRLSVRLAAMTIGQRIAVGAVGLSAVVAWILLLPGLSSLGRLSAMERMASELKEVKSYGYQCVEHVTIQRKGQTEPGLVDLTQFVYWRAPGELREELKIVLGGVLPAGYHPGQVTADIIVISRTDGPGIFVDRSAKTFCRLAKMAAEQTGSGSLVYPMLPLRTIREQPGKVLRDLGSKKIQGNPVHGL